MLFSVWHQYCQPPPAPKRPFSAKRHTPLLGRTGAKQVQNRMPTAIFTHSALVLPPIVLSCSAADFRARTELSSSEAPAATTGALSLRPLCKRAVSAPELARQGLREARLTRGAEADSVDVDGGEGAAVLPGQERARRVRQQRLRPNKRLV